MADANWVPIGDMAKIVGLSVPKFRALHERLGRPCQEKRGEGKTSPVFIDTVGWLAAYTKHVAGHAPAQKKTHKDRREMYLARSARLDWLEREQRLIDVDRFNRERLDPFCDELRRAMEVLGRVSPDGQKVMLDGLARAEAAFGTNGHSNGKAVNGTRSRERSNGSARKAADPEDAP